MAHQPVAHRCTKYCQTEYQFGNVYRCVNTGYFHICDCTCDQQYPVNKDYNVCAVSGRYFPARTADQAHCLVPPRKRGGAEARVERLAKRGHYHEFD